jgi:hypothetical protein
MGIGTDSANFPPDFNFPGVIFLQDYPKMLLKRNKIKFSRVLLQYKVSLQ